jgi:GYF domain 2
MIYTGSDPDPHKTTNSDHTADGWYYANKNGEVGPYNLHDLKLKFAAIPDTDGIFVWRNGMSNWQRISDVPEFNERMQPPPPPLPYFSQKSASTQQKHGALRAAIGVAVLLFLAWMFGEFRGSAERPSQLADLVHLMPEDQQAFVTVVARATHDYGRETNDLVKAGTRADRAASVCAALGRNDNVDGWLGTITTLSSNSDGEGVLVIQIWDNIYIDTWNNSFSDIGDHTLIDPNSALFRSLSTLKVGQRVRFSGTFFSSPTDCVKEASLTLEGSMTKPDYKMRFRMVEAFEG